MPVANASLHCDERGESYQPEMIASPGGRVSDQMTCDGKNFDRYRVAMRYASKADFAAGTLTIDGNARLHGDLFDNDGRVAGKDDYAIELHGSLQISGANCRVNSWRQRVVDDWSLLDDSVTRNEHLRDTEAAARCSMVLDKG